MRKTYYVYIMASDKNGTLYIGVTNDIARRAFEHKTHHIPGFTSKYNVCKLVYVEAFSNIEDAIHREKRLKEWKRDWKKELIESINPQWDDLYDNIHMWV